jgi:hypothetical protein
VQSTPELPVHFENTLFITAAFPLPSRYVHSLLPANSKLNLVEVFPRRAVLVVSFAFYRSSPFGAYAEATISLMAIHEQAIPVMTLAQLIQESRYPAYVLHMVVNNAEAQRQGIALWALPRLAGEVHLNEHASQVTCQAALDEQMVLKLVVERPDISRTRTMQIETYSQRDDTLLLSIMHCNARAYGRTQGSGAALTWGEHSLGQQMAQMQVSPLPLMMRYYDQMEAELGAPNIVE